MGLENKLEENIISRAILETYSREFLDYLETEVAVVGAGPAGLSAAYNLARQGIKTAVFEKNLSIGGGMWGGGVGCSNIVVQEEAKRILDEHGILYEKYKDNYYVADAIETVCCLGRNAIKAGAKIFNLKETEDVIVKSGKVAGIVINSSAINRAGLHVDPIAVNAEYVIDATGHAAELAAIVQKKAGKLNTDTGKIIGEKSMNVELGEKQVVENTREAYNHLWVAGMAANTVYGGARMGPIFGSMLLSGEKAAQGIIALIKSK